MPLLRKAQSRRVRNAGNTVRTTDAEGATAFNDAAEADIAQVLRAEREARAAVEQARLEVERIGESARSAARGLAERTERRIRAAVVAFERDLAVRLADIEAQSVGLDTAQPLSAAEAAALQCAVKVLAREWVEVRDD